MFGYFGKGYIAPPPTGIPGTAPTATVPAVEPATVTAEEGVVEEVKAAPKPLPPEPFVEDEDSSTDTEADAIRSRLQALRAAVEAKRAKKEAKIAALRAKQAKQAAYGRDVVQARPKKAGYATESEKLMGGRTGYGSYSPYGHYSRLGQSVDQAAADVKEATRVVEQVTKDVKAGMATRSELARAMADLDAKIQAAKGLVNEDRALKGYGEEKSGMNPLWILVGVGILYLLLRK